MAQHDSSVTDLAKSLHHICVIVTVGRNFDRQ